MYFNSITFLVFFPCFFTMYWLLRGSTRVALCLVGSYIFYGWWAYEFLGLILISTLVDYLVGLGLGATESRVKRKWLLGASIACNLGILATFKYLNFFAENLEQLVAPLGWKVDWPTLNLILPAGISFYTFQTLSYSIDVYRGRILPERNLLRFATFVSFFPQLVAGPIVWAGEFLPQLGRDSVFDWDEFERGVGQVLQGFFKKLVIADSIAIVADPMFEDARGYSSINMLVVVVLYAFQVYCDFSGYSDIAIGLAKMLGFKLPENFRFPYFATSPADFWHRWHITLSTWLRDYVYIPLGGNRHGEWSTYRNLAITMLLGGLWHGASWNFVIWGALHANLLILHRVWVTTRSKNEPRHDESPLARWLRLPVVALQCGAMFAIVCVTWVFFRASTFGEAIEILGHIASLDGLSPSTLQNRLPLIKACGLVVIFATLELAMQIKTLPKVLERAPWARGVYYASLVWIIAFAGTFNGTQFIYFQF